MPTSGRSGRLGGSGPSGRRPSRSGRVSPSRAGRVARPAAPPKDEPRRKKDERPARDEVSDPTSGSLVVLGGPELLPRAGAPVHLDAAERDVRRVVGELREVCGACGYRRICAFAPAKLQVEVKADRKARHRHARVLQDGLERLRGVEGNWERGLVRMLAAREKDALLAGCLLSQAWRKDPAPLVELLRYTHERCGVEALKEAAAERPEGKPLEPGQGVDPERLQTRMFRGQVLRLASFFTQEEALKAMQELLVLDADEESRLFQYEAVAALALLVGRSLPGTKWIKALERDAPGPFRATFAARDPGNGAIDVFFPYRHGRKRSYLYLRRDPGQVEALTSVEKIRIDSLLYRMFLVFGTDGMKTHRVFKELCRHINVRAGKFNVNHVLSGFERLSRDDLLLLGIYAPALARAVGHFLECPDYHLLVKLLYAARGEGEGDRRPAHEGVLAQREAWAEVVDAVGTETIKGVFALLFRLNASYVKRAYTTPTYLKIGEVAYLFTAVAGWNPKGLELELKQGKKPLAAVAYGMQPPGKWSRLRVGKLRRALERARDAERDEFARAVEQGMRYMAVVHGYPDFGALERAAQDEAWEPPSRAPKHLPVPASASAEEFSEYEGEQESDLGELVDDGSSEDDEPVVLMDDEEVHEDGRLKTQRMRRQASDVGKVRRRRGDDDEG
ncbi:MAG: hypothetical protein M9894_27645 [Planctomycetes bacterium]|nr:hypothetical protein [Planctomycetota bacterium]